MILAVQVDMKTYRNGVRECIRCQSPQFAKIIHCRRFTFTVVSEEVVQDLECEGSLDASETCWKHLKLQELKVMGWSS